ncbi:MAG: arsenic-transporting ATPase [Candidatus Nephthysia bennettiae]|uniref:arsenite-transporting ATPase n=1 Tax=Candidatus Nephthysia bennettiae TaxID=3127016 RepID=A0A934K3Q9_9BACT|nr:ArsA family ATPase [Candidatus Dormibacteraeota bacterium]MBJ7614155.1 ArsA family ATPase [Candidatus Dormibacteraeota bacterium]PZR97836.1 MAG: arsenic-transporting ATPase [Candidatus Dormibacteraeota bacterium]
MRVILFTGKGGVGKTSVAAATALRCAQLGHRTVVMSTDPAHSLGDSFDRTLGSRLTQIAPNLWGHEVSALHEMERHWRKLHDYAASVFATQGLDDVVAEEVANPPGMDEVASLMWIKHYAERGEHDVIIVDCAPTGETLQLLMFPDAARWWLDKIYPWERKALKLARPVLQPLMDVPLPSDEVFASIKDLLLDLEGMKKVLVDPKVSSVRLVLNLEKMVIKEAKRAFTYLSLFGYVTDAVVVNRTLPDGLQDELFRKWHSIHQRYSGEVEQSFQPLPIFNVPLFDEEVVGEKMLLKMAETIYGARDPAQRFYEGSSQRVEKREGEYVLALKAPFVERGEVSLTRHDGELFVTVGNYRREVVLPRVLAGKETVGASLEDGELRVRFAR